MFQNFNTKQETKHTPQRIKALRNLMNVKGVEGIIVPKVDRFQGEYIPETEERLAWISGFTGSAGTALILLNSAVLFVDGRYTIQAKKEVDTKIFEIINSNSVSITDWLQRKITQQTKIVFDPWLTTVLQAQNFFQNKNIKFLARSNFIDQLWVRKLIKEPIQAFYLDYKYAGESFTQKLAKIRLELSSKSIRNYMFCKPDAICWLLNIRGGDVEHNPIVNCFAILKHDDTVILFSENLKKFSKIIENQKHKNLSFENFSKLKPTIKSLKGSTGFDISHVPYKINKYLASARKKVVYISDPADAFKSIKNTIEIKGIRKAHQRDGVAHVKFLYWFFSLPKKIQLDEITIIKKLETCRANTGQLKEISFDTICGSGPNGAIIHYRATEKSNRRLNINDVILIDSGGQYIEGTTDITRVICKGKIDNKTKTSYTHVLKGLIALSSQLWPKGLTGQDLDPIARQFLWNTLSDYEHGTGHGVGAYLCVHEGPAGINRKNKIELKPGMILSIEPGFYKKNKYGIRLENLVLVQEVKHVIRKDFLFFETLSTVPFQKNMLRIDLLDEHEKKWLNKYHKSVVSNIGPKLSPAELKWLENQCTPIS